MYENPDQNRQIHAKCLPFFKISPIYAWKITPFSSPITCCLAPRARALFDSALRALEASQHVIGLQFFLISRIRYYLWKITPFFAKVGTSVVYALIGSGGAAVLINLARVEKGPSRSHYFDVTRASQITGISNVCSIVCSGLQPRKINAPHHWPCVGN